MNKGKLIPTACMSLIAMLGLAVWVSAQESSIPSHGRHHTYRLTDLGTLGGNNTLPVLVESVQTLSADGVVAGCSETSSPNPEYPKFNPFLYPFGQDTNIFHAYRSTNGGLRDLGTLPGGDNSCALWISDNGQVAGASEIGIVDPLTGWPEIRAVLWREGRMIPLGNLGGNESFPVSVNNQAQVTGFATNSVPDDLFGFGTQVRAFLWERGVMRDLGTLGGPDAFGIVVNARGQVLGFSLTSSGRGDGFLWQNGRMQDIPDMLGGTQINPFYLNDQGMAIGNASLADEQKFHPFLWHRGAMQDLGTFGGSNGEALWVNQTGQVVGAADIAGDTVHHAFLWQRGRLTDLGSGPETCSAANAINAEGQIVGFSSDCQQAHHAILWEHGEAVDLSTVTRLPPNMYLAGAQNINDRGEIVAVGVVNNAYLHTLLLTPAGECDGVCEQQIEATQTKTGTAEAAATGASVPGLADRFGHGLIGPSRVAQWLSHTRH